MKNLAMGTLVLDYMSSFALENVMTPLSSLEPLMD